MKSALPNGTVLVDYAEEGSMLGVGVVLKSYDGRENEFCQIIWLWHKNADFEGTREVWSIRAIYCDPNILIMGSEP